MLLMLVFHLTYDVVDVGASPHYHVVDVGVSHHYNVVGVGLSPHL